MIDLRWPTDRLCEVLRWQLDNSGAAEDPDAPEVPWAGRRVWSIFLELNSTRTVGFAPNPISILEIEAWSRLKREPIRPFELDMLQALDAEWMKAARETTGQEAKPKVNARPFSMQLFDAWFGG